MEGRAAASLAAMEAVPGVLPGCRAGRQQQQPPPPQACRRPLRLRPLRLATPPPPALRLLQSSCTRHSQEAVAHGVGKAQRRRRRGAPASASTETATQEASTSSSESFPGLKRFLADAASVGRVRVIVNTGMGVLESVTTLDSLFYRAVPGKGEYANLMKAADNVDFHLLLDRVAGVQLEQGTSKHGGFPTCVMRFHDSQANVGATLFVMWRPGTKGDYDPGQVETFEALLSKYGEHVDFFMEGSEETANL
eukprot:SM000064S19745  [mRNA]  locus=s64:195825:197238:+ [translate_table: standard]